MNIGKIISRTLLAITAAGGLITLSTFQKGKRYEETMDKTFTSIDNNVICGMKSKKIQKLPMKDAKFGCFGGGLEIDLSEIILEKRIYDIDVQVLNGYTNIVVPDNVIVNITDQCRFGTILDITKEQDIENQDCVFSLYADVNKGVLLISNSMASLALSAEQENYFDDYEAVDGESVPPEA